MAIKNDISGKKYERLTAIREFGRSKNGEVLWLCKCDCGNEKAIAYGDLVRCRTKSCGCARTGRKMPRRSDYTGKRFGRLTVLKIYKQEYRKRTLYICKCDCGTEKIVAHQKLREGTVQSCGCYQKECASNVFKELNKTHIGKNHPNYNHDLSEDERVDRRTVDGYKEWQKQVLKRDNYKCQCCGSGRTKTNPLNVHHKYSYAKYKNLRTVNKNGITLCKECHIEFHVIYGKRDNTEPQLIEFLQLKQGKMVEFFYATSNL